MKQYIIYIDSNTLIPIC